MPIYFREIRHRSDILDFFVYLRCDLQLNFNPDERFEDYVKYTTDIPLFTPEECVALEKMMDDCHAWCDKNNADIYDLARYSFRFYDFLNGYKKLTEKKSMKEFSYEFIDKYYSVDPIIALHTYDGCYWIEEFADQGKILYQCIIENTNPYAEDLRTIERVLFDWTDKGFSPEPAKPREFLAKLRNAVCRILSYK